MKSQAAKVASGKSPTRRAAAKASTRARLIKVASRIMRRHGLGAASVPRVMSGAGLTVGGFYAHFRSKRAMDAEVLAATIADVHGTWFRGLEGAPPVEWMTRAVRRYLSRANRDRPSAGCPLPAVLSELTHGDAATRAVLDRAITAAVDALAEHAPPCDGATPRERALATIALCIGGLTLSRAVRDPGLSDELLAACARWAVPEATRR
jgi:TetR/AcrR family transcriptional repressor of nem operon